MENFTFYNPVKLIFGKDSLDQIGIEAKNYGSKALVIIGKNSVKKSGVYARVISLLNMQGVSNVCFQGVKSNPTFEDADEAVKIAIENEVDMIIALGGGSVLDTSKAVSMGFYSKHSVWDFYSKKQMPEKALPLLTILTLAATGSEMNNVTVLQDTKSGVKSGFSSSILFPKVSILDPTLTFSVPANYTAFGVVDLISHCLESFFGKGNSQLSDYYIASIIKLAIEYGEKVKQEPENYENRANIMWLATNALNGSLMTGKTGGEWGCHALEHTLSVLFDIPHGAGLSIVFPAWMKFFGVELKERLEFLSKNVFDIEEKDSENGKIFISKLEAFFSSINSPVRLEEVNITKKDKDKILENFKLNKAGGSVFKLDSKQHEEILNLMWK